MSNKLNTWTIIWIGFSILLLMLSVIIYQGYAAISQMIDCSANVNDIQTVSKTLLEARRYENDFIMKRQPEWRDKALKAIEKAKKQVFPINERVQQAENKKLINDVAAATNEYEAAFKRFSELALYGGDITSEQSELDKKMETAVNAAQSKCEIAVKVQLAEMKNASATVKAKITLFCITAILLGVLFAFLITHGTDSVTNQATDVTD